MSSNARSGLRARPARLVAALLAALVALPAAANEPNFPVTPAMRRAALMRASCLVSSGTSGRRSTCLV